MAEETNSIPDPATRDNIHRLARGGILNVEALDRALKISGDLPDRKRWDWFLDILLLIMGAGALVSGIFFFFAFNWARMHRYIKFGILDAAILIAVGVAFWQGLERLPGKIALGAAGLLVGGLLAVYGQVYQTGADSYQLFLYWALIIAGWVLISKFTPMWVGWILLLNISLVTFWLQIVGDIDNRFYLLMFVLNGSAVIIWELGRGYGIDWLQSVWAPRVLFVPAFAVLLVPTMILIFSSTFRRDDDPLLYVLFGLFIALSALVLYAYSQRRIDLFMLTVCAFGLIIAFNAWVAEILEWGTTTFLFLSALFIGQAALIVRWLRQVSISWEARENE